MIEKIKVALVAVPQFSMLDVGAVVESIKQANSVVGHTALDLTSYAIGATLVLSGSGLSLTCDRTVNDLLTSGLSGRPDLLILCCGSRIPHDVRPEIRRLLQTHYRLGAKIIGLGNAAWLFAEWGLLNERPGTVHWQYLRAFSERYINVDVKNSIYVDVDRVLCCAGEAATLDLMFELLRTHVSETAAYEVLDRLLIAFPRSSRMVQPGSQEFRLRHHPAALQSAMRVMAANIEEPLSIPAVASAVGVSVRQLERLFKRHLKCPPRKTYLKLQLEQAVQLLEQTEMPLAEISVACGMQSASTLSRNLKQQYGMTPTAMRNRSLSAPIRTLSFL